MDKIQRNDLLDRLERCKKKYQRPNAHVQAVIMGVDELKPQYIGNDDLIRNLVIKNRELLDEIEAQKAEIVRLKIAIGDKEEGCDRKELLKRLRAKYAIKDAEDS